MGFAERALVVGAGIGGLTAALALRRAGLAVDVIEIAPRHNPVGAGIVLGPNAVATLAALGVELGGHGRRVEAMSIRDRRGRLISRMRVAQFGETVALARPALHEALAAALPDGVSVRFGSSVTKLSQPGGAVTVRFEDDTTTRYDLVIGADGLRSRVRALVDEDLPTRYSGYTCWRALCRDPGVLPDGEVCEYWGRGARAGLVPLAGGQLYVFLVRDAPPRTAEPSTVAGLRDVFADFPEPVRAALDVMRDEELLHHDLHDLPEFAWGRGRVWLLGDAAHGMLPNQGQGAAMAIEDALALIPCIEANGADVGLDHFIAMRQDRVARVHRDSYRLGQVAQWSNPIACAVRDALFRLVPASSTTKHMRALLEPGLALARKVAPAPPSAPAATASAR